MSENTLTPEQTAEIEAVRSKVIRWIRHYFIGTVGDVRGHSDALIYHFLKEKARGQYWPEKWLMMHGKSVLVGDGSHLLTEEVVNAFDHALNIGPFEWRKRQTPTTLSAWERSFGTGKLVRTVSAETERREWIPEAFDDEIFIPSHLFTSDDDVYETVLGYSE